MLGALGLLTWRFAFFTFFSERVRELTNIAADSRAVARGCAFFATPPRPSRDLELLGTATVATEWRGRDV